MDDFFADWFLYWLVPSAISFILSSLMLVSIMISTNIRREVFPQLYALLAMGDMLQTSSWIYPCYMRLYIFELGTLLKCSIGVWSSIILYVLVCRNRKLTNLQLRIYGIFWISLPVILVSVAIVFETSQLFCDYNGPLGYTHSIRDAAFQIKLAHFFTFVVPVVFVLIVLSTLSISNLYVLSKVGIFRGAIRRPSLIPLIRRIQIYPLIYAAACIPGLVYTMDLLWSNHPTVFEAQLTGITCSISGALISTLYFTYSHTKSFGSTIPSEQINTNTTTGRRGVKRCCMCLQKQFFTADDPNHQQRLLSIESSFIDDIDGDEVDDSHTAYFSSNPDSNRDTTTTVVVGSPAIETKGNLFGMNKISNQRDSIF
jgi:hypothetical protein